ncbi:MAG: hypothetical protein RBT60_00330 [Candidatus Krumholzibacteria bacterium]|jgi:hypothetical protein|nr:hypothetical protein [Candidatus Krumholzibacteria bacterium]
MYEDLDRPQPDQDGALRGCPCHCRDVKRPEDQEALTIKLAADNMAKWVDIHH